MVFYNEPAKILYIIIGFLIYRGFDIVKPFPIRRLENLKGGWGIMMDDIVAGIYSNIVLSLIILFFD
jgi:phosphatidylglycerophosphatase A